MTSPSPGYVHPYEKLARQSPNRRKIWVVAYVADEGAGKPLAEAEADVEASLAGGADAVIFINEFKVEGDPKTHFSTLGTLERTIRHVREKWPKQTFGVNFLGTKDEPYGFHESFRLARTYNLGIVWTDFSGVDLIHEAPPIDLQKIQAARPPEVFYASGVHMKYSTLVDPKKAIEESALQAMGWLDGIIVTGPATGKASDPEKVRRARAVIGKYPLGVASGVTPENVHTIKDDIDFVIVHTGIQEKHRIVASRVRALREALDR